MSMLMASEDPLSCTVNSITLFVVVDKKIRVNILNFQGDHFNMGYQFFKYSNTPTYPLFCL